MKKILGLTTAIILLLACNNSSNQQSETEVKQASVKAQKPTKQEQFIRSIETAHHAEAYNDKELIQFDFNLIFGGKQRFQGIVTMSPNGGIVRMQDSTKTMIWDGEMAYLSPADIDYSKTRFDVLTWSYFFAAPYKLDDPGTKHELLGNKNLNGQAFSAMKLTFKNGVGDSPDDWYVVYQDQETDLLAAMAYVVTYSKSLDQAEEDPHAITYEAYDEVDGIPFATQWNFWTWNEEGELNKLLGEAQISNIQFIKKADDLFKAPANSRKVEKPAA
jgi:hypothetical protein